MRQFFVPVVFVGLVLSWTNCASAAHYNVFLLGGQSNMDGRGAASSLPTSPVNLQQPQSDVAFYYLQTGPLTTLRPLTSGSRFGPEITFGRAMANAFPARNFALIKYSRGGTSLAADWRPGTGSDYSAFKTTVANGLAALTSAGHTWQIDGMLWIQGESDTGANATAYATNLTSFIADMRSSYGASMPFVIGGIGYSGSNYATVSNAQAQVAAADPRAAYFSNTDLNGGTELHFDAVGLQTIGLRFADAVQSIPEPSTATVMMVMAGWVLASRRRTPRTPAGTRWEKPGRFPIGVANHTPAPLQDFRALL